ncbi:FecR family protein [Echinicola shivajiensis]|uniref:FecR family protein n=1 Tax=Echinicola shivajiensis TaxID=1035916 RepID=UPI001BFCA7BC|nr:FecR domain-containing protein [Echinicola shivajiensis]
MDKSELKKLLSQYSKGKVSEAERERLIHWYKNANDNEADEFLEHLGDLIDNMDNSELISLEEQLSPLEARNTSVKSNTGKAKIMRLVKVAATLIIFLVSSFFVFQYIRSNDSKILEYRTNVGEIREIVLPDQSTVVLNSVSVLRVPEEFSADAREVSLEGEAFFDVERDETKPFSVMTGNGVKITVLGTSFNINDYSDGREVEVAVASGKVAVGKEDQLFGKITKGQQITYDKVTHEFLQSTVENVDSWIDGKIMFSQNSLGDVTNILNRIFAKQLIVENDVDQGLLIKGNFDKDQGIEGIVDILCVLHGLEYENKEDQIIIKNKKID